PLHRHLGAEGGARSAADDRLSRRARRPAGRGGRGAADRAALRRAAPAGHSAGRLGPVRAPRIARSALLALLALAAGLGPPAPSLAAEVGGAAARGQGTHELDRNGFVGALNHLSEGLLDGGERPGDLPALRRALPSVWTLRIDDRRYEVPTAWLDEGLKNIETHPASRACVARDLRARLAALRAEARGLAGAAMTPSLTQARGRLDAILRQREFRGIGPPGLMR